MCRLWWAYTCCWLVSLSYHEGCYGKPSGDTVIVPKDVPVELPCHVGEGQAERSVARGYWSLSDDSVARIESSGNEPILSAGYNITDKFALIVKKTQPGTLVYKCRTYNENDVAHPVVVVSLDVGDNSSKVVDVPRGDKVTLSCPVDKGRNVTWYNWTAEQRTKLTSGLKVTISEKAEFDAGVFYMCATRKDNGELVCHYFTLRATTNATTTTKIWLIPACIIPALVVVIGVFWWRRKKRGDSEKTQKEKQEVQGPDVVPLNEEGEQLDKSSDHVEDV